MRCAPSVLEAASLRERQANSAALEVRSVSALSHAELREAAALLAMSFDDTSLFCLAFPNPATRRPILQAMFAAVLKDAMRFGRVKVASTNEIVGVVIWYLPGRYPMSILRILRLLPEFLRMIAASPLGVLRLFRAESVLDRHRPTVPHCHGHLLCARPGHRVGGLLTRRVLNELDHAGLPVYLETQESRCLNLYARFGFRVVQNGFETPPGGPLTWTMWRDPRPTSGAPHRSDRESVVREQSSGRELAKPVE